MVFSSSAVSAAQEFGDPYYYLKRQLMWAFLGSLAMIFVMEIDYFRYAKYIELFLIGSFILLGLVLVAGISSHGSSRWLGVGFLRIQPSEVMKLAMVLFLSKSMSRHPERIQSFSGFIPYLLVLGLACGLILYQPDLGSAVVLAGTTYLLFAAGGARISHLFFLALAGMALIALAIIMAPYRMNRFMAFLDPWADPLGDGFQTIQALLALGSGGLFGLGLGCSRQKLFWLPARHTDFIYAIIGEELGFIGAFLVLVLFFLFLWRGYKIAISSPDNFAGLLSVGITTMIAFQAVINLGVVTGSLPVTGITLPFISYGGSSLIFSLIGVGILLNISRYASLK